VFVHDQSGLASLMVGRIKDRRERYCMAIWKMTSHKSARFLCALVALLALAAGIPIAPARAQEVIELQSTWKYNDSGEDLGTAWRELQYDDSTWKSGVAPLGYGNTDVKTEISFGSDKKNKHPTYYFRQTFTVTDTQSIESLRLNIRYDDGFVAYLNGAEIARGNMAITRTLSYDLLADTAHRGKESEVFELVNALPLLAQGQNVLAVEVHQFERDSGKVLMDASLSAGLITDPPAFVDEPQLNRLTDTSVHLQFQSNVRTQARVEYGIAPATDQSTEVNERMSVHDIVLNSLQPNTMYRYRVGIRTTNDQPFVWTQPLEFSTLNLQSLQMVGHILTSAQSEWKYDDSGKDLGTAWREPQYDDGAWKAGLAPLGYGYPETATQVSFGSDSKNKYATTYFRKTFEISDTKSIESLNLYVRFDDGFVAYLNGVELVRANMSISATLTSETFANSSRKSVGFDAFDLSQSVGLLQSGRNVIAFEVHQNAKSSSDLLFDASLSIALISDPPMLINAPLLGQVTDSSIHVQFESNIATLARVEYGVAPEMDHYVETTIRSTTHDVVLSGLGAGTTYRYRVGIRTMPDLPLVWSTPFDFTTDGGPGSSFRFAVWADSRPDDGFDQPEIFLKNLKNLEDHKPLALAIAIGDNVQLRGLGDTDATVTSTVRSAYMGYYKAVSDLASSVPIYAALGNHDNPDCAACLAGYRRYLPNPTVNGERFYSFDHGDAHFTILDSRQNADGGNAGLSPQEWRWLRDDLTISTKRYKFVFIHDAMFHNQDSEVYDEGEKAQLHQLFLSTGVTAVFQGDAHYYDYTVEDGLPYIITGGAGSPLYKNPFNPEWSVNQTLIVSVSPNEVGFQSIGADGGILDRHTLKLRAAAMPEVQSVPTSATQPVSTGTSEEATSGSNSIPWFVGAVLIGLLIGVGALLLILRLREGAALKPATDSTTKSRHVRGGDVL
jgi:hypothetical protein